MQRDFRLGDWHVQPALGRASRDGLTIHLRARVMDLLVCLAGHSGQVVSKDDILNEVWKTEFVSESALTRVVADLRQAFGDDVDHPALIETIPKRGYRLIPRVVPIPDVPAESPAHRRSAWSRASAATVLLAVGVAVWFIVAGLRVSKVSTAASKAFSGPTSGDLVLLASFENATGDPELDDVIGYAIERELGRSRHVRLVTRERVEDVFRLMKRPVETELDEKLAREVGVRDGGVRVVLAGRVDRIGSTYTIGARLLEADSGQTFASATEEAPAKERLIEASHRLADRLRVLLGEAPARANQPASLELATTSSLRALKLYSESYRLGRRSQWKGALDLVQQAVAIDPDFATAQIWLAWALRNTKAPADDFMAAAQRALALADGVDDAERFWIVGSYYYMAGDMSRAEGAYQALLQLRPDDFWANNNLVGLYRQQNRDGDAVPYQRRLADLRPHDRLANVQAARALTFLHGDFNTARRYVERVRQVEPLAWREAGPWLRHFEALEYLSQRNVAGLTSEVTRILDTLPSAGPLRDPLIEKAIRYWLTTGQVKRALAAVVLLENRSSLFPFNRAYIAFAVDDFETARRHIRDVRLPANLSANSYALTTVWMMVRLGLLEDAEHYVTGWADQPARLEPGMRATIELSRDNIDDAIPLIESFRPGRTGGYRTRTARDLAEAWLRQGQPQRAVAALRNGLHMNTDMDEGGPYGPEWMPNALLFAELCRQHGCAGEAQAVEADLEKLLVAADPDFPLLVKLRRLQAHGTTRPAP